MAKVTGPLFSMEAHGNVAGGTLQFRAGLGGTHAYRPMPPADQNQAPPTPAQEAQRLRFKAACNAWMALPVEGKAHWTIAGLTTGQTGFAAFVRDYLLNEASA